MRLLVMLLIGLAVGGCRKAAPPPPAATPAAEAPVSSNGEETADQLEVAYLATSDLRAKIEIMTELADMPPAAAVEVIGRLFYYEEDTEMRAELLRSMLDVEGQTDAKRTLLEEAIHPDLPLAVRLAAIDLLAELGDKRAAPALQRLRADPDQQVREASDEALNNLM